jgi:hypothetical protein
MGSCQSPFIGSNRFGRLLGCSFEFLGEPGLDVTNNPRSMSPVKGRLDAAGRLVDVNGDGKIDLRDASTQPAITVAA